MSLNIEHKVNKNIDKEEKVKGKAELVMYGKVLKEFAEMMKATHRDIDYTVYVGQSLERFEYMLKELKPFGISICMDENDDKYGTIIRAGNDLREEKTDVVEEKKSTSIDFLKGQITHEDYVSDPDYESKRLKPVGKIPISWADAEEEEGNTEIIPSLSEINEEVKQEQTGDNVYVNLAMARYGIKTRVGKTSLSDIMKISARNVLSTARSGIMLVIFYTKYEISVAFRRGVMAGFILHRTGITKKEITKSWSTIQKGLTVYLAFDQNNYGLQSQAFVLFPAEVNDNIYMFPVYGKATDDTLTFKKIYDAPVRTETGNGNYRNSTRVRRGRFNNTRRR